MFIVEPALKRFTDKHVHTGKKKIKVNYWFYTNVLQYLKLSNENNNDLTNSLPACELLKLNKSF